MTIFFGCIIKWAAVLFPALEVAIKIEKWFNKIRKKKLQSERRASEKSLNLRPVFNFAPRGESWPTWVKLAPGVEVILQGKRPSVHPFAPLNIRECSPHGGELGVKEYPLGTKFTPGGQVHPWVQTHFVKKNLPLISIWFARDANEDKKLP
jgi:hypothetical protein